MGLSGRVGDSYLQSSCAVCVGTAATPSAIGTVEELTHERGLRVDHSTVYRWVQTDAPQVDKHCRRYLRPTSDSWRVDEVYVKVKGKGKWLYRAMDKHRDTLHFCSAPSQRRSSAKRFCRKTLNARNSTTPSVINVNLGCCELFRSQAQTSCSRRRGEDSFELLLCSLEGCFGSYVGKAS